MLQRSRRRYERGLGWALREANCGPGRIFQFASRSIYLCRRWIEHILRETPTEFPCIFSCFWTAESRNV